MNNTLWFKTRLKFEGDNEGEKIILMNSLDVMETAWIMGISPTLDAGVTPPEWVVRDLAEQIPTITEEYQPTVVELLWAGLTCRAAEKYSEAVGVPYREAKNAVARIWRDLKEEAHAVKYYNKYGAGLF